MPSWENEFINSSGTSGNQSSSSGGGMPGGGFLSPSDWAGALQASYGTSSTKTTTGTQAETGVQSQISPEALALISQVFPQLFAQSTGGDYSKASAIKDSQGIVNQVMQQLKEQVLPQIYTGESARGGYSSTAKALLTSDAASRAAAQAASLVGDIATKYGGVQATQQNSLINLINAAVQASKTGTTDTTKTIDQTDKVESPGLNERTGGNLFTQALGLFGINV